MMVLALVENRMAHDVMRMIPVAEPKDTVLFTLEGE